ncbi:uncharacterized protein LOC114308864 isoform X3 [Camellia sinensis]|uniref:uncharacterized protein LOC114308864 isoform X3 n=1 Tax=Camellia sinensis TaxID=4442 RepID=UPI001036CD83|nr:uncharacterized protein LOC114308864 isoform X3 [Camellia sinensis]
MNCFLVAINFWTILFMLRRASSNYLSKSKLIMDSNNCFGGSQRLTTLARHLRLYKPPPTFDESDIEEQRIEESAGKLVSQVGFVESATPIASQPERFKPKRAAVLICLFEGDDGDLRVILTKRSSRLSTHSGEVALPGGKAEEGDKDDAETATREAKEEIGLDPSLVSVVNVLEPFLSKHLLRVIPVICILSDKKAFNPAPNVAEVEAVFDAPLEMFIKDENRMAEEREWMGEKYLIHSFDYETDNNQKYMIWGLTAGILIRAASVVYQRPPAFREQNPKFKIPRIADKHTGLLQVQEACLVVHTPLHYTLSVLFIYTVPMLMNMKGKDELMDSNSIGSAGRLMNIAQQLRLFHTNYNPIEDPTIKDSAGKAVPQDLTTNSESATNPPERIRSKRAAVLICLFEDERGDLRVILTKRSSTLSTNSGGKTDEGDANDVETALREAKEEIGLDPSLVIVVTVLHPLVTKVGITVVPVVGILPDKRAFNPTLNTAEVESIFDAPLAMFLKDQNRRAEEREWMGDKYLLHFFDHETENGVNYVIWALTAGILIRTASIVYQQPPDFQVSEPKFWTRSC